MPNLQDFEGELFQNIKKKGKIVSIGIAVFCNNIVIILLSYFYEARKNNLAWEK